MTSDIGDRIRLQSLLDKVVSADEAATLIHDGMMVGMSGFTRTGGCKAVPFTLAQRAVHEPLRIMLMTGTSLDNDIGKILAEADAIARRLPFQASATLRYKIDAGEAMFIDQHLLETVKQLCSRQITPLDVVVVEATTVTENSGIVPTTSVGNSVNFAVLAKQAIIEVNLGMPANLEGPYDIFFPMQRPYRQPIPFVAAGRHIGLPSVPIDPRKIAIIVVTGQDDSLSSVLPPDTEINAIAGHLNAFLAHEMHMGRLSSTLQPLQADIGTISNTVLHGFINSPFHNLKMYSEVLQDDSTELLDSGKLAFASASLITLSRPIYKRFLSELGYYRTQVVLRPQEISNHLEVVRRLGLITVSTALECDIYDNVSSAHVGGTHMMDDIGGSDDFSRNAHLSVLVTELLTKDGNISSIVPMISHMDHTEHDANIIVAGHRLADLRGLTPHKRAVQIISNCVDPRYHELLRDYVVRAQRRGGHAPHLLEEAPAWHVWFRDQGSTASARLTGENLLPGPTLNA